MSENEQSEVRRIIKADPRLASAINKRYAAWPSSMRSEMFLAIARAEKAIEAKHFLVKELQDGQ